MLIVNRWGDVSREYPNASSGFRRWTALELTMDKLGVDWRSQLPINETSEYLFDPDYYSDDAKAKLTQEVYTPEYIKANVLPDGEFDEAITAEVNEKYPWASVDVKRQFASYLKGIGE
uniref:Uncharacterized protein n=1 Tax=Coniferiporia sulphurascens TaxID=175648 RepID=A0A5B9RCK8_CONSH|nr:hypothetical protein PSUO_000043 [Coniferiporia sulphurascens]QEG57163.1 hypothetical protein PSUO_000043 [Coniferiporia sulphurascens]